MTPTPLLPQRKPPHIRRLRTGRARVQPPLPLPTLGAKLPTSWPELLPYVAACNPVCGLIIGALNVLMHARGRG